MLECPCNKENGDCTKRHIDCHSTCLEYKIWREELDKKNELKKSSYDQYIAYIAPKRSKKK